MSIEKRIKNLGVNDTLELLNAAQSFALGEYSLGDCEMAFVRDTDGGSVAVIQVDGHLITIDDEGEVDQDPDINIRS